MHLPRRPLDSPRSLHAVPTNGFLSPLCLTPSPYETNVRKQFQMRSPDTRFCSPARRPSNASPPFLGDLFICARTQTPLRVSLQEPNPTYCSRVLLSKVVQIVREPVLREEALYVIFPSLKLRPAPLAQGVQVVQPAVGSVLGNVLRFLDGAELLRVVV